ncbi:hypothetical protein, partial [uncultured Agrococcus sp.]|uniref:hypothetical protein n=1 Tax=uncultured Agrococcus sp. TaxID=382258 RepID=UPI0025CFF21B
MKTAKAIAVIAAVLGCVGCVWAPGGAGEARSDERERGLPQESQDAGEPDAVEDPADRSTLEPPLAQAELEPLLTHAFEGLYEGLVLLRRGDIEVDVLFDYATRSLIEQQLRVFGSSIPADYVIDGRYSVAGLR